MIKCAALSILDYYINVFLLFSSTVDELQKILNFFWWGSKKDGLIGINWMAWDKLCVRKEHDGMGFRHFHAFNLAMLEEARLESTYQYRYSCFTNLQS